MITANNEQDFILLLGDMDRNGKKLIRGYKAGNRIRPIYECRIMATAGGLQYGFAEINSMNQRGSGIYTMDIEEAYLIAYDFETKNTSSEWFLVDDCEHTYYSEY